MNELKAQVEAAQEKKKAIKVERIGREGGRERVCVCVTKEERKRERDKERKRKRGVYSKIFRVLRE